MSSRDSSQQIVIYIYLFCFCSASLLIVLSQQPRFQALKRIRHPNILSLYGYSLNANHLHQYLVYEHSAHGSLDGFLRDDENRSRLTANKRLLIMFQLTRAVHFLHNGGCKNCTLFHRDIQSANIWLSENYTARLMDCGLAQLVPIISNASTTSSVVNGLSPFGSRGYMCPEYLRNANLGRYEAAYDVYSVGVVMMELILGHLIGESSFNDDSEFFDVFSVCVKDEEGSQIMNGCEWLKEHVDRSIVWTPEALDVVCKAAIGCLTPTPVGRMKATELLDMLDEAACLNSPIKFDDRAKPEYEVTQCVLCLQIMSIRKCYEGHAVCPHCIEIEIIFDHSVGRKLVCPFQSCTSHYAYLD